MNLLDIWRRDIAGEYDAARAAFGGVPEACAAIPYTDSLSYKTALVRGIAENCGVFVLPHYPFAYLISTGQNRTPWYGGAGGMCGGVCGADRRPDAFIRKYWDAYLLHCNDFRDYFHRAPDYDRVLEHGLRGVAEKCAALNAGETDPAKRAYRQSQISACQALKRLAERFSDEARRLLPQATDDFSRANLARLAECMRRVPWEAPRTMFEAMETILFLREAIDGMDGVADNTLGMLDRLLYPFYKRDGLSREEAYQLITLFLYCVDAPYENRPREELETAITVMIGGQDAHGAPVYNEITEMIMRAYAQYRYVGPKLNARVCKDSSRAYYDSLSALILAGVNNVVLMNDEAQVPMLQRMGVRAEDARKYVGCGCQEVVAAGTQIHSRAYLYANMPGVLLDTLYGTRAELYGDALARDFSTFDALLDSVLTNLRALLKQAADTFAPYDKNAFRINPELLYGLFVDDCAERGLDPTQGGARYDAATFSLTGFGTFADSLLCLRDAVYGAGYVTLDALTDALRRNFSDDAALRERLRATPGRYGTDTDESNAFCGMLADKLSRVTQGLQNGMGVKWGVSLFAYMLFQRFGAQTGATPDGRADGETLSRGMGPCDCVVGEVGLTAAALSAAIPAKADFHDTAILDLTLEPGGISEDALAAYLAACMALGVPTVQINVVRLEDMLQERDHPGTHPGLVVRVCGFSARFCALSREMQDEVIGRRRLRVP